MAPAALAQLPRSPALLYRIIYADDWTGFRDLPAVVTWRARQDHVKAELILWKWMAAKQLLR